MGDRASIDVALEESVSLLNEVVVTGYGSQKRSNISGSVSTVNAEEIAERPITRVEQALQGRVAGVQVAQVSGSPGSAQTVRIRGVGTINNSDPLYIVDGIPVDGLDFLNPNDIETMNVLIVVRRASSPEISGRGHAVNPSMGARTRRPWRVTVPRTGEAPIALSHQGPLMHSRFNGAMREHPAQPG